MKKVEFIHIIDPTTVQILRDASGLTHYTFQHIVVRDGEKHIIQPVNEEQSHFVRQWTKELKERFPAQFGRGGINMTIRDRQLFHVADGKEAKLFAISPNSSGPILSALHKTRTFRIHRHKQGVVWQYRIAAVDDKPTTVTPKITFEKSVPYSTDAQLRARLRGHVGDEIWKECPLTEVYERVAAKVLPIIDLD